MDKHHTEGPKWVCRTATSGLPRVFLRGTVGTDRYVVEQLFWEVAGCGCSESTRG